MSPNWSVVHQGNLHHGLENAILHPIGHVAFLHFAEEVPVQDLGVFPSHCPVEVGLAAFFCRSEEGELRDWVPLASCVEHPVPARTILTTQNLAVDVSDAFLPLIPPEAKRERHGTKVLDGANSHAHQIHHPIASASRPWRPTIQPPSRCLQAPRLREQARLCR